MVNDNESKISLSNLDKIKDRSLNVTLENQYINALRAIADKYKFSPRRETRCGELLRIMAAVENRVKVEPEDILFVVPKCLPMNSSKDLSNLQLEVEGELKERLHVIRYESNQSELITKLYNKEPAFNGGGNYAEIARVAIKNRKLIRAINPVSETIEQMQTHAIKALDDLHRNALSNMGVLDE